MSGKPTRKAFLCIRPALSKGDIVATHVSVETQFSVVDNKTVSEDTCSVQASADAKRTQLCLPNSDGHDGSYKSLWSDTRINPHGRERYDSPTKRLVAPNYLCTGCASRSSQPSMRHSQTVENNAACCRSRLATSITVRSHSIFGCTAPKSQ